MNENAQHRTLFIILRRISKNVIVRKILPHKLQSFFGDFVLKNNGRKLRKEIIKYCKQTEMHPGKIKDSIDFLKKNKNSFYSFNFLNIWLCGDEETGRYFDFNGARLPDISNNIGQLKTLLYMFWDTFLFFCLLNDNYSKKTVDQFDPYMIDGPYGYCDTDFDVTIKEHDIVIDAGAWIGDFSAYASAKGATTYAFEPLNKNYEMLLKTVELNGNQIIPVKKGLGNNNEDKEIYFYEHDTALSSVYLTKSKNKEIITITTLDDFAKKENMKEIDFIKADIEGMERYLLMGAKRVLKEFAPKLAICTYHFPEDPKLLEKIILDANQNYRVVHTKQKLFAMVK